MEEESPTLFPSPSPEVGMCVSEPPWLRNYNLITCLGAQVVSGDTGPRLGKPQVVLFHPGFPPAGGLCLIRESDGEDPGPVR